jgi:hypothetical protein
MLTGMQGSGRWPTLPALADWQDTCTTVHMWSQMLGKVRLALAPPLNHSWGSALYVTGRGLTTSPMPWGTGTVTIDFDFVEHRLVVVRSSGERAGVRREPMTVAAFHEKLFDLLRALRIDVRIYPKPVEVPESIPFAENHRDRSYDADSIHAFWLALVAAARVMERFRSEFIGKSSPVHFFWGAFDLAVTRFSGRTAPLHPGGAPNCPDRVMQEAYSHEVSSAGFWPGTGFGEAAFYSYAYPEPEGFRQRTVAPAEARFDETLGEFVLPYTAVQASPDPDAALMAFLRSTYEAAAELGDWDRAALERQRRTLP